MPRKAKKAVPKRSTAPSRAARKRKAPSVLQDYVLADVTDTPPANTNDDSSSVASAPVLPATSVPPSSSDELRAMMRSVFNEELDKRFGAKDQDTATPVDNTVSPSTSSQLPSNTQDQAIDLSSPSVPRVAATSQPPQNASQNISHEVAASAVVSLLVYRALVRSGEGDLIDIRMARDNNGCLRCGRCSVSECNGSNPCREDIILYNGDCGETRTRLMKLSRENPKEVSLYAGDELVGTLYTPGGSYHRWGVAYYCPSMFMKDGVCTRPQIDIISRTMEISDSDLATLTSLRDSLCTPSVTYIYTPGNYDKCLYDKYPNADSCEIQFVPYANTFDPRKITGRWHLMAWYFQADKNPTRNVLGMTADIERKGNVSHVTYHVSEVNKCSIEGPIVLRTEITTGRFRQDGMENQAAWSGFVYSIQYDSYLILWSCPGELRDTCEDPRVSLWSRGPLVSPMILTWTREMQIFLCNNSREYLFPPAAYNNCPKKENKGANGTARAMPAHFFAQLVLVSVIAIYWSYQ